MVFFPVRYVSLPEGKSSSFKPIAVEIYDVAKRHATFHRRP